MKCTKEWVAERVRHWHNLIRFIHLDERGGEEDKRTYALPTLEWGSRMTHTAATVWSRLGSYGPPVIRFSLPFMKIIEPERYDRTIAHEVCHYFVDRFYQKRCTHNRLWKAAMLELGFDDHRCHDYGIAGAVLATCSCKTHSLGKVKAGRLAAGERSYFCRKCKCKLKLEG